MYPRQQQFNVDLVFPIDSAAQELRVPRIAERLDHQARLARALSFRQSEACTNPVLEVVVVKLLKILAIRPVQSHIGISFNFPGLNSQGVKHLVLIFQQSRNKPAQSTLPLG